MQWAPNWLPPPASVFPPLEPGGGGQHSLASEGGAGGGASSDDWRESLALCLLCGLDKGRVKLFSIICPSFKLSKPVVKSQ
jgi:hypothetical protein